LVPEKLERCGYTRRWKIVEDIFVSTFVSTEFTNVTDRRTPCDGTGRAYA